MSVSLSEVADAIANMPVSSWLAGFSWVVPMTQSIHIFAIAILLTSALIMALRLAGIAAAHESPSDTVRRFLPWIHASLVILFLTGCLLILIEPQRELLNVYFQSKMLLFLSFLLVLSMIVRSVRSVNRQTAALRGSSRKVRGAGLLAVGLLLVIIWCGRWIAYTQ